MMAKAKGMPLWGKIVPVAVTLGAIVAVLALLLGGGISVSTSDNWLSFDARVAMAATVPTTDGTGSEVQFDIIPPTFSRGGLPVMSVSYADGIAITFSGSFLEDISYTRDQLDRWAKNKTIAEAEEIINGYATEHLELWILLSDLPPDDRVLEDPPVLLDNERFDRRTGKDYLVVTIGYFAVHLYDMTFTEGSFITRLNGLEAGPVEGEWWL